jgi:hypothetical protein
MKIEISSMNNKISLTIRPSIDHITYLSMFYLLEQVVQLKLDWEEIKLRQIRDEFL